MNVTKFVEERLNCKFDMCKCTSVMSFTGTFSEIK